MFNLALIGDIHLHATSPRYAHTLDVLDWTITDALARGATGVVFLGDVCEAAPAPMEIADLAQRFGRIQDAGAWAAVAQGNHEHPQTGAIWECLGATTAWDRFRTIDAVEVVVLLIPFPRRGRAPFDELKDDGTIAGNVAAARERITKTVSDALTQCDGRVPLIVLGHVTLEGMRVKDSTFEVHSASEVVVPRAAFRGVGLAAVGHIHTPQDVSTDPPIIGVGSLIRHSFAEADDAKSYTLVTVEDGRVSWERVPVPCHDMRQLDVAWPCAATLDELYGVADEYAGKEVKLVVEIPADQVATFDPSVFDTIKARAALFTLEKRVLPTERVRAPQLGASGRLEDEVGTWLSSTGTELDEARRARVLGKVAEVAG